MHIRPDPRDPTPHKHPGVYSPALKVGSLLLLLVLFFSCQPGTNKDTPADRKAPAADSADAGEGTPVTLTTIGEGPLDDYIELNAVSAFLQKSYVKANASGYLQSVNTFLGKPVQPGQTLFTLKTKEAQSIGDAVTALDSSFRFSGMNTIRAHSGGYITQLDHQSGDYVQDGEQLAVISDGNSFVFLMNMPYELRPVIMSKKTVELTLPDGERLNGFIQSGMPTVDSASQTQNIILRVNARHSIPENLIAKARILQSSLAHAQSLPKAAVLSDETQSSFWVMRMIDGVRAVKVPIRKGRETGNRVEILSPVFSPDDKILLTGNYGLPDTASVNPQETPGGR